MSKEILEKTSLFSIVHKIIFHARLYLWYKISLKYKIENTVENQKLIKQELSKKILSSVSKHNKSVYIFSIFKCFQCALMNFILPVWGGKKRADDSSVIFLITHHNRHSIFWRKGYIKAQTFKYSEACFNFYRKKGEWMVTVFLLPRQRKHEED